MDCLTKLCLANQADAAVSLDGRVIGVCSELLLQDGFLLMKI
jgi:hypothetical protein